MLKMKNNKINNNIASRIKFIPLLATSLAFSACNSGLVKTSNCTLGTQTNKKHEKNKCIVYRPLKDLNSPASVGTRTNANSSLFEWSPVGPRLEFWLGSTNNPYAYSGVYGLIHEYMRSDYSSFIFGQYHYKGNGRNCFEILPDQFIFDKFCEKPKKGSITFTPHENSTPYKISLKKIVNNDGVMRDFYSVMAHNLENLDILLSKNGTIDGVKFSEFKIPSPATKNNRDEIIMETNSLKSFSQYMNLNPNNLFCSVIFKNDFSLKEFDGLYQNKEGTLIIEVKNFAGLSSKIHLAGFKDQINVNDRLSRQSKTNHGIVTNLSKGQLVYLYDFSQRSNGIFSLKALNNKLNSICKRLKKMPRTSVFLRFKNNQVKNLSLNSKTGWYSIPELRKLISKGEEELLNSSIDILINKKFDIKYQKAILKLMGIMNLILEDEIEDINEKDIEMIKNSKNIKELLTKFGVKPKDFKGLGGHIKDANIVFQEIKKCLNI